MHSVLSFSLIASLVIQASASASSSLFLRQSAADGLGLNMIPDACQPTCAPIVSTVNSCQELSCLCNNDVAHQIADCGNCLVGVSGDASAQSKTQDIVDQFTNACNTSGEPVSSIQLSSIAPSGTASSSGSGSTVASATTTSSASSTSGSDSSSSAMRSIGINSALRVTFFAGLTSIFLSV